MNHEAINAFWTAWPDVRGPLEREIAAGEYGDGTERLTDLVEAIDPNLEWELTPGEVAANALAVSAAADARLRLVTQAWVDAAPPADRTWEFHPARIAVGPEEIELAGMILNPRDADMVVIVDPETETLDLQIGHPDFADIDESLRFQAAFRFIDDLVGEDDAERWIGSVDVLEQSLPWGVELPTLAENVARLAAEATGEQWTTVDLDDPQLGRSILVINRALKRLDHLELTLLAQLSVELPGDGTTDTADDVEDDLEDLLGERGLVFARETYASFVVIYAYCRPQLQGAILLLEDDHDSLYDIAFEDDPGWDVFQEML